LIPERLKGFPQWVVWKLEKKSDGKTTKIPYDPKNIKSHASSTDPSTWATYDAAMVILNSNMGFRGVGFVFTKDDPFIGIDFDHCIEDGWLTPTAELNVTLFNSYTEISQSGTGLHVIAEGLNPGGTETGHKCREIEFYTSGRFFALTGNVWKDYKKVAVLPQSVLLPFYKKYFSTPTLPKPAPKKSAYADKPKTSAGLTDEKILEIIGKAANSVKFNMLWGGSVNGYVSPSEADMALCTMLAFYTKDHTQLKRLLLQSGLCREKTYRDDYLDRTVEKVTQLVTEQYERKCWRCGTVIPIDDGLLNCPVCRGNLIMAKRKIKV
jgi:primase-polymerase (primpol)-like protein